MFHADGKETNRKEGQTRLERCALHARLAFRPQHTRRARPFHETRAQTAIPLYIRRIYGTHDRTRGRHGTFYLGRDVFSSKYYRPEEITPAMRNRRIRIIGGPLHGYEGSLVTVRGTTVKRLLVELPMLLAAAVEVEPEFIQLL